MSGITDGVPAPAAFRKWVRLALAGQCAAAELCIRLVDEAESAALNAHWRKKDRPTNVLSFPMALPEEAGMPLMGDLVICPAVVAREAGEQGKLLADHWAHLVIHGILHLLGLDHLTEEEAAVMEAREVALLARLGVADPYP